MISGRDRPTNLNKPKILEEIISLIFIACFFVQNFGLRFLGSCLKLRHQIEEGNFG